MEGVATNSILFAEGYFDSAFTTGVVFGSIFIAETVSVCRAFAISYKNKKAAFF
jgi:hypothetical protein